MITCMSNYYTVQQAAAALDRSPVTIRQTVRLHPEIGQKIGRDWVLTPADLDALRATLRHWPHHDAQFQPGPAVQGGDDDGRA